MRRTSELKVKFGRKCDCKRDKCEDPEVISGRFKPISNTKAKYDITNDDTYNCDQIGFIMGVISTGATVTASEKKE